MGSELSGTGTPIIVGSVQRLLSSELENLFSLGKNIYSGGSPGGTNAFAELRRLGIKTIISVDGTRPDVQTARKFGMRYIHLPIGYEGTSLTNAWALVKATQVAEGPLYIHCHHGKHRGPAAAAMICRGTAGWNAAQGLAWLEKAGTSHDYPGLFAVVRDFKAPGSEELARIPGNFPEQAAVSGLVEAMVAIDRHWENLRAVEKAGYKTPVEHPDLDPLREAILLAEAYREAARLPEVKAKGAEFEGLLVKAASEATALREFLKNGEPASSDRRERAEAFWKAAGQSCAGCHKKYRN